jgi:Flp pilus assembly pilin Flp
MSFLINYVKSFVTEEEGQTFTEYALVLVVILLALAATDPQPLVTAVNGAYAKIAAKL